MLTELSIKNYVLIENAKLSFGRGLNVLTGETGAGKSIVLDCLYIVLGERASPDLIRKDADEAIISAVFNLDSTETLRDDVTELLNQAGFAAEDPLILRRILSRNGRSRNYVNDQPCTLKVLKSIGNCLVDIHGQHEHQSLLYPGNYLGLVDAMGGLDDIRSQYENLFQGWKKNVAELAELADRTRERARLTDQIRFEIEEIQAADLKIDEEEELKRERQRLRYAAELAEDAAAGLKILEENNDNSTPSLEEQLGILASCVERMAKRDEELLPLKELSDTLLLTSSELTQSLRDYVSKLENDPNSLETIEQRLHLIQSLKRKYGSSIEDILKYQTEIEQKLNSLDNLESQIETLERKVQSDFAKLKKISDNLTVERQSTAQIMAKQVTGELHQLGMNNASMLIEVLPLSKSPTSSDYADGLIGPHGADRINFLVTTNLGDEYRKLADVASGGEISRIMLALKVALAEKDRIPVLIFDEIDVGIGGQTGHVVGDKMKQISSTRQLICITHLAQIAALADHHLFIDKSTSEDETLVSIRYLEQTERKTEIARMLGAATDEAGLQLAEKLLVRKQ